MRNPVSQVFIRVFVFIQISPIELVVSFMKFSFQARDPKNRRGLMHTLREPPPSLQNRRVEELAKRQAGFDAHTVFYFHHPPPSLPQGKDIRKASDAAAIQSSFRGGVFPSGRSHKRVG